MIIAIFALTGFLTIPPLFTPSDNEIKQKARSLPEVKALYERYNGTSEELERHESISHNGAETDVQYLLGRYWHYTPNATISEDTQVFKMMGLNVQYDVLFGARVENLICTGDISSHSHGKPFLTVSLQATVEEIKSTDCLENPGEVPPEFLKH